MRCGEKIVQKVGEGGVKMKNFEIKKRLELLSRKSQKNFRTIEQTVF